MWSTLFDTQIFKPRKIGSEQSSFVLFFKERKTTQYLEFKELSVIRYHLKGMYMYMYLYITVLLQVKGPIR